MITQKEYLKLLFRFDRYKRGYDEDFIATFAHSIFSDGIERSSMLLPVVNGRTAIYLAIKLILKNNGFPKDANVIVQGFTCNAAVNPIIWAGAKPKYIDINTFDYSLDLSGLSDIIDDSTVAILLQHSFGLITNIDEVLRFTEEKGITLIEDCAHSLGIKDPQSKVMSGLKGDMAIFSFGVEKMLSTRLGGLLLINSEKFQNEHLVKEELDKFTVMPRLHIFLWLLNPLLWKFIRALPFGNRKVRIFMEKIGLLKSGVPFSEYSGIAAKHNLAVSLPGVIAQLVSEQLEELPELLKHRQAISEIYLEALRDRFENLSDIYRQPLIKFPLLMSDAKSREEIMMMLKNKGIPITDWYSPNLYPSGTSHEALMYKDGQCPVAEDIASRIINLPTGKSVTPDYAKMISNEVINYLNK